jgi:hypothetical protein
MNNQNQNESLPQEVLSLCFLYGVMTSVFNTYGMAHQRSFQVHEDWAETLAGRSYMFTVTPEHIYYLTQGLGQKQCLLASKIMQVGCKATFDSVGLEMHPTVSNNNNLN